MAHPLARPRWIVGSIIVLALVVLFINLGFWQLRRLDERRALNETLRERSQTTIDLPRSAWGHVGVFQSRELEHQRVRVRGRYDTENEVLVRFQTHEAQPGYDVVTPLKTDNGIVFVDRGWVPERLGEEWPAERAAAPEGDVTVIGVIAYPDDTPPRPSREEGLLVVSGVRPAAIADELGFDTNKTLPYYLRAVASGEDRFPVADGEPDLSEGPHLNYAIQWFIFATVVGIGWVVLLWHTSRRRPIASPGTRSDGHTEMALNRP